MKILAIETSCDETAAAVLADDKMLSNIVASQIEIHQKTGGIVPEVASRAHVEKILPVIEEALKIGLSSTDYLPCRQAGRLRPKTVDGKLKAIDLIAVTIGPGLIGSLLVGVETAKTLAYLLNKPIMGINHLEGHIFANFIGSNSKLKNQNAKLNTIKFPAIVLIVSGGHTSLILMKELNNLKIIGETRDDAAGEAFDKVAQILGLGYPGGPAIEKKAREFEIKNQKSKGKMKIENSKLKISFPRPMLDQDDFSFSGLKTSVLYKTMKLKLDDNLKSQIAYEFQKAIVETLVTKTIKAAQKLKVKSILLSGGVAANKFLRTELEKRAKGEGFDFHVPAFEYCTDNAAMIGMAAYIKSRKPLGRRGASKKPRNWSQIEADANLGL
jgi:N6-L-threonylcarbamoyladenine synthase